MKELIVKHFLKSVAFGAIMTIIELLAHSRTVGLPRVFILCSVTFFVVNVLFDWVCRKIKKRSR